MRPLLLLPVAILLAWLTPSAASAQVLEGPGSPVHHQMIVNYWGAHPVPPAYGDGFCYAEGPHTHPYLPVHPDFFAIHDGYYVFTGDPFFYGYEGEMRWFAGPHVIRYPWGDEICYIDGPHRHWLMPYMGWSEADYVVEDGYWVWVGFWPAWYIPGHYVYLGGYWPGPYRHYYEPRVVVVRKVIEKHPPRHHVKGETPHQGKSATSQGVPPATYQGHGAQPGQGGAQHQAVPPASGGAGYVKNPKLLPAYDENRDKHQPRPKASAPAGREERFGDQGQPARPAPNGGYTKNPKILPAYNENRVAPSPPRETRPSSGDAWRAPSSSSKGSWGGAAPSNRGGSSGSSGSSDDSWRKKPQGSSSGSGGRHAPSFGGGGGRSTPPANHGGNSGGGGRRR